MAFPLIRDPLQGRLYLLATVLFISYLCVAIALPVVPVFVTTSLKLDNVWAGLAVGVAFFSTIASRGWAGRLCDSRGSKTAVLRGLACYIAGALVSLVAGLVTGGPLWAFLALVAGRLVLGLGESLVAVGVIGWGIAMVGPARSGKVLALVGAAIYGALACGGPLGIVLVERFGFSATMAASAILPLLGLIAILAIPGIAAIPAQDRPPLSSILRRIWAYGLIICLQGIGFAAIGAFFALYFRSRGWDHVSLGLTAFGTGFVLVRLFFGHMPDRFGGLRVAIFSLAVEAVGQFLIAAASGPILALVGAFMTGLGCSMIFPSMGREVVHLVEPRSRGVALGGFSAFQDLSYGLTGPLVGLLADHAGYSPVFLIGGAMAALGFVIAVLLQRQLKQAAV